MAGMIKVVLLMTLVAVFFLPENGVEAAVTKCYAREGGEKDTEVPCSVEKDALTKQYCYKETRPDGGKEIFFKGCELVQESVFKAYKDGCMNKTKNGRQTCYCDKDLCNSTTRLHGQSSSVLSLCVISIFLAISFFGKP